jgi:hypothetical protein
MLLSALQKQALALLSSAGELQIPGVSVFAVDTADSASAYAEGLAACGTSVGILPPTGRFRPDSDGPVSTDGGLSLLVNVSEPIELSRAQGVPPVTDLAETVACVLHSQNNPGRADEIPLGLVDIRIVPDKEMLIMQVVMSATGSLSLNR